MTEDRRKPRNQVEGTDILRYEEMRVSIANDKKKGRVGAGLIVGAALVATVITLVPLFSGVAVPLQAYIPEAVAAMFGFWLLDPDGALKLFEKLMSFVKSMIPTFGGKS